RVRKSTEASEIAVLALDQEMDSVLDYSLILTLQTLKPYWIGKTTFGGNINHIAYAVKATKSTEALSSLFNAYKAGKIAKDKEAAVLQTVASLGGKNELKVLIEALGQGNMKVDSQLAILKAINSNPDTKRKPQSDFKNLETLLNASDEKVAVEAALLAGNWRIGTLLPTLKKLTSNESAKVSQAAIQGVAGIGGKSGVKELVDIIKNSGNQDSKTTALSGLVNSDLNQAASLAVELFQSLNDKADTSSVFDAFIRTRGGSKKLKEALSGKTIPEFAALAGVRQANTSGQKLDDLVKALSTAGKLKPVKQMLTAEEMGQMVKDVNAKGNPLIGEQIYRRKSLACVNCHAISGAGTEIGPDLISIGASAPVDYIIDSILQPAKKIKEGYHMTMVATKDGKMISGTEVSANNKEVIIRDAAGQKHTVAANNVKKRDIIPFSMMPPGLTATLNNDEFIHLISFLSNLGKDGDFKLPTNTYLRTLKFTETNSKMISDLTKRKPEFMTKFNDMSWQKAYSKVNGFIPLNDGSTINKTPVITRFDIKMTSSGKVGIKLSDKSRIHFRDYTGAPIGVHAGNIAYVEYNKGTYPIFMIVYPNTKIDEIRLELIEVEGSAGRAEFTE
ncbi:MAG: c-type cytochrome, partial [Lentisphaeraceae bacterium]|nr:c-type cytochrome [Lentisphaeraceae bacterium]